MKRMEIQNSAFLECIVHRSYVMLALDHTFLSCFFAKLVCFCDDVLNPFLRSSYVRGSVSVLVAAEARTYVQHVCRHRLCAGGIFINNRPVSQVLLLFFLIVHSEGGIG